MSSNRPSNTSSNRPADTNRPAGSRPPGGAGRPPGNTPRPPGNAPRPPAGRPTGGTPPRRPTGTTPNRVQVRPTRPQNSPPATMPANRMLPLLLGGGLVLLALVILGTIFLNNTSTPPVAGTPALGNAAGQPTVAAAGNPAVPATAAAANPAGTPAAAGNAGGTGAGGMSTVLVETPKGNFKIHLFTDDPSVKGTVQNFQTKVQSGYFNGLTFHRVEDWVVQGGDPKGTGTGGGDIPGEYNQRAFKRGGVGMASTGARGAQVNDSQWFVVKKDSDFLNGDYSNFAQVTDGLDVVDKIAIGDKMTKLTLQP